MDSEKHSKHANAGEVAHSEVASNHRNDTLTSSSSDDMTALNQKLANPLAGKSHEEIEADIDRFVSETGLHQYTAELKKGALVAQDPLTFENLSQLSDADKELLRRETTHRWDQPRELYTLVILCSLAAAVQGMDESVINGALLFFSPQFGIDPDASERNQWLQGLVTGAPYLCCAVLGCWLTAPLNKWFGRRGTIFITATLSWLTCFWSGVTNSWPHLFIARFVLGLGIGPKSTTVPVYSAECAPANIRGALVMMWQMWTAFGIMLGYVADLAFYNVKDTSNITGLNWRLMLGSAGIPAIAVMAMVYLLPESPRWLISKGRYEDAFNSLRRLRNSDLQAARDLYYIHVLLEAEKNATRNRNLALELFTVPRNRRASLAAFIVMFMQQFCGINAVAYYSSTIFREGGLSVIDSLLGSWGFGMVNWLFAFPAVWTIDRFGRRNLLLVTFPAMAVCLVITGSAFYIPESDSTARVGVIALGIYLFCAFYSPGEGPVPFTYSAEAFPLYVRDIGMSFAVAVTWGFNFIVALTFPSLLSSFTPSGAFYWYAAWNIVGFFMTLVAVPETKALSLEELDQVFNVPTHRQAARGLKSVPHAFKYYILRRNIPKHLPPLYDLNAYAGPEKRVVGDKAV